jgi:hypothetical protein
VNKRSNDLGGEQNWLPPKVDLITKTFKLKAVDFLRMSRGAMTYVFDGVYEEQEKTAQKQTLASFNETLRLCLSTHFNADGAHITARAKQECAVLMEQVAETMSLLEMSAPLVVFDKLMHELVHVPMALLEWNSCRVFWAFKSERYPTSPKTTRPSIRRVSHIVHYTLK